jgi:hypothetical protein
VFENRVLRRIFGLKRDEVTGGWRKLLNEELHNLYCSTGIIGMMKSRRIRWARHIAQIGRKKCIENFGEKLERKRPLGRLKHKWQDDIKMDLREIGWGGMDWTDLVHGRDQWRALVNTIMNLRVPQNVGKFLSSCTTGGFSRRAQLHGVSYIKPEPQSV